MGMSDKERRAMLDRIAKAIKSGEDVRQKVEACRWKYGMISPKELSKRYDVF